MEARELRFGNFVKLRNSAHPIRQANLEDITAILYPGNYYEPIPLTEEWLFKFGFSDSGVKFIGIDTSCRELQVTKKGEMLIYDDNDDFIYIGLCKYVHQLQNLYFALTGKELEIKSKVTL